MPPPMPKLKGPLAKLVLTKNRAAARHNFGDRHPESGNEIRAGKREPLRRSEKSDQTSNAHHGDLSWKA